VHIGIAVRSARQRAAVLVILEQQVIDAVTQLRDLSARRIRFGGGFIMRSACGGCHLSNQ
jgi:hypothetical protein